MFSRCVGKFSSFARFLGDQFESASCLSSGAGMDTHTCRYRRSCTRRFFSVCVAGITRCPRHGASLCALRNERNILCDMGWGGARTINMSLAEYHIEDNGINSSVCRYEYARAMGCMCVGCRVWGKGWLVGYASRASSCCHVAGCVASA